MTQTRKQDKWAIVKIDDKPIWKVSKNGALLPGRFRSINAAKQFIQDAKQVKQ